MTLKVYVGRDSEGRPRPPDYDHETVACLEILRQMWLAFDSEVGLYLVVANLQRPNADFVILSERGIGIIEFKHHFGRISQTPDGTWLAGYKDIEAGAASKGYINPRVQVQDYATTIREQLTTPKLPANWLPGSAAERSSFRFQTAVCFTNPDADVSKIREAVRRDSRRLPWEEFSILTAPDVPTWAAALRFEVTQGRSKNHDPYRLDPTQVLRIATDLFNLVEWTEAVNLMPMSDPYAYLVLHDGAQDHLYALDREEIILGRDPEKCDLVLSNKYPRVGLQHARIVRRVDGIWIEDLDSKHGTYVDGVRITQKQLLTHGQAINLGKPTATGEVCLLEFLTELDPAYQPNPTAISTVNTAHS